MTPNFGVRYLTDKQFVSYCEKLNVKTDLKELEHYEKIGVMFPVARVRYPEEYVKVRFLCSINELKDPTRLNQWPEISELFEEYRYFPRDYLDLDDQELIHSFDRVSNNNPYFIKPKFNEFQPWKSCQIKIKMKEYEVSRSTIDTYYSYWQVHQLYEIQKYPDLYKNRIIFSYLSDEVKKKIHRPWTPGKDKHSEFKGLLQNYDSLSFWITVYDRERKRTYAPIPEKYRAMQLNESQLQAYSERLDQDAKLVQKKFGLTCDGMYAFLIKLLNIQQEYEKEEKYKLSKEIIKDIYHQVELIELLYKHDEKKIIEEIGNRAPYWTKGQFKRLSQYGKEKEDAFGFMVGVAKQYKNFVEALGISDIEGVFTSEEVESLFDYCENEGLTILITALSGMIATRDELAAKFRRVTRYINLQNILTSLEFLLKSFEIDNFVLGKKRTLNPVIIKVMGEEGNVSWIKLFETKTSKGMTSAKNPLAFFDKLDTLLNDPILLQSEDNFWAREFLVVSLARNLTVHTFPNEDWFFGDIFGEILNAAVYSILCSWKVASREGWVLNDTKHSKPKS